MKKALDPGGTALVPKAHYLQHSQKHLYLNIFHYTVISKVARGSDSSGRECIWGDIEERPSSGIGDGQGGNSHCISGQ